MPVKTLKDIDVKNKTVLVRVDFNVPMENGEITDDNRIVQALPTLQKLLDDGAKVVCFSHLGRIKTREDKKGKSLDVVARRLGEALNREVVFVPHTRGQALEQAVEALRPGEIMMFENTRFEDADGRKESKNDPELGKYWASLGDIFVNDAFGTAHRAHASNVGIAAHIEESAAGYLLEREIKHIGDAIEHPKRPFVAILGGIKVSDKIGVIRSFLQRADKVLIGGGMSYTFMKAQGFEIGESVVEDDKIDLARTLLAEGEGKLHLPEDFKLTKEFSNDAPIRIAARDDFRRDEMGLDIGPKTLARYGELLSDAKTVVWNGPVGVFEMPNFAQGTEGICKALAALEDATTVIGGGDSAAAAISLGYADQFTHISTGGGASLEFMEGKPLPGIGCLDTL